MIGQLSLSVDGLMAKAREISGVDLVDDAIVEPLTILHRDLNQEARLDEDGAREYQAKLLRLLTNRLRMKRDFLRHPEILDQPIKGPVIVTGVPRSGTTKLQKALAASGDFNFMTFWRTFNWASFTGQPSEPVDARIAEADVFCRWFDKRSPETKLGHGFETLEPEEEGVLSEGSFVAPAFIGFAELPNYVRWLGGQQASIRFEFMRDALKYLQWQGLADSQKPWLMKSPNYNGLELEIRKVFPGVRFVVAHRSPLKTLPSMCKLVQCFRMAYNQSSASDNTVIMERNFLAMEAHLAMRRAHPDLPFLDLRFEGIVKSLTESVQRIYDYAGLHLSAESLQNMQRWDAENTMHKHGEFKYSIEQMGLSEAVIRQRMATYFAFLDTLATRG